MSRVQLPVPLSKWPTTTEYLDPVALRRLVAELSRQLETALLRIEVLEARTVVRDGVAKSPNARGQIAIDSVGDVYIATSTTGNPLVDWTIVT